MKNTGEFKAPGEKPSYNRLDKGISAFVLSFTILTHLFTLIEFIDYNSTHHGTTVPGMEYAWYMVGFVFFVISILLQFLLYHQVKKNRYPILCICIQVALLLFALLLAVGSAAN